MQEELQQMTLSGTAGGGMVTAEVNGQGLVKRIKIESSVVNPADVEMLEDLITAALTDAQRKAQEQAQAQVAKITGGMNLPFKLPI